MNKDKSTNSTSMFLEESALNTSLSHRVVETHYYDELVSKHNQYQCQCQYQDQDQEQEQAICRNISSAYTNTNILLINGDNGDKIDVSYISSFSNIKNTQESTTTLLSARELANAGHNNYVWETIESLVAIQGTNEFVPRHRYLPDHNNID